MRFWNRKQENQRSAINVDKVARVITATIEKMQRLFDRSMNRLFKNMSPTTMKWMMIVFVTICGCYSLYLVMGVFHQPGTDGTFSIQQIHTPKRADEANEQPGAQSMIGEETFQMVQAYRMFLDSLESFNRPLYDSFFLASPHLLDSLKLLEDIYSLQQNSSYEK